MKKVFLPLIVLAMLASCYPKQQWAIDAIHKKEKTLLLQAQQGKTDTTAVNALLTSYQTYADKYPADTTGAEFLFKAADFYRYMGRPNNSIALYKRIYAQYPAIDKRPYALFLQGFTYENELNNLDSAQAKYQQFVAAYPAHPFTKDVRTAMNNLGKTPEQLIEEFQARESVDSLQVQK